METDIGLTPVGSSSDHNSIPQTEYNDEAVIDDELQSRKSISTKTQLQYARNGHAALRSIITSNILKKIKIELIQHSKDSELDAWRQKVEVATKSLDVANSCKTVLECKSMLQQYYNNDNDENEYRIPFLQHFNTWQSKACPTVTKLVLSPLLASMASQLLDVPTVRLYQDSLFHKRCDDGPTPWHSDARMAPFDTSNMITFWFPLDNVPSAEDGGTGLYFVDKSHVDFALPFWNPVPKCDYEEDGESKNDNDETNDVYGRLNERYGGEDSIKNHMPLEVGDCTVHAGWTLHCADGMSISKDRYALAITYVDARAEIRFDAKGGNVADVSDQNSSSLGHDEDRNSFRTWIGEVEPRQNFEHPLVPIVWPPS